MKVLNHLLIVTLLFAADSFAETNYTVLQNKCQGSTNPGCCIGSVRAMRDGQLQQSTDGKCPEGFKVTKSQCEGSLSWCAPQEAADIAVNGGATGDFKEEANPKKKKVK